MSLAELIETKLTAIRFWGFERRDMFASLTDPTLLRRIDISLQNPVKVKVVGQRGPHTRKVKVTTVDVGLNEPYCIYIVKPIRSNRNGFTFHLLIVEEGGNIQTTGPCGLHMSWPAFKHFSAKLGIAYDIPVKYNKG